MHRRRLGQTGLEVSILGMGSSPFRHGTPSDGAALLDEALDLGVDYYDTARSYVNGEEAVGELAPHRRQLLTVATKTGYRGGSGCVVDLHRSLRTIRRDRIDVWMTHMIRDEHEYELCTALGGFCDIAEAARQAGFVRASGASFHAPTPLILRAIEERAFDVVMFQLNLIGRETVFGSSIASYRDLLLPAAVQHGVGVVIMKTLAGGELRHGAPRLGFLGEGVRDSVRGAVRYAVLSPAVNTAVVGMANRGELRANVDAVAGVDDAGEGLFADWAQQAAAASSATLCTRCGLCLDSCPEGIEIPKVFRLLEQQRAFGMTGVAAWKYAALERDASACSHCGRCQAVCPEDFEIAAELGHAHSSLAAAAERLFGRACGAVSV